jgi:hypothetical protein
MIDLQRSSRITALSRSPDVGTLTAVACEYFVFDSGGDTPSPSRHPGGRHLRILGRFPPSVAFLSPCAGILLRDEVIYYKLKYLLQRRIRRQAMPAKRTNLGQLPHEFFAN